MNCPTFPLTRASIRTRLRSALACVPLTVAVCGLLPTVTHGQTAAQPSEAPAATPGGPLRLRQPVQAETRPGAAEQIQAHERASAQELPAAPYRPGEFELHVQATSGRQADEVRRFGAELLTGIGSSSAAGDFNPLVPVDYTVQPGDELVLTLWGSIDADLRLQVDRTGRIAVPRVGPILVAGVRYAELGDVISKRVAMTFKNVQVSVSLGQLRGIRVYVTGFVQRPGVQVVSGLATLAQAVMKAGGPSAAGSFRNVQLRRGSSTVASFDLYDLLLKGDRSADRTVQADDVIHIGPVGPQVGLIGSVNRPAIFELKPGEVLEDVLAMSGGFAAVADRSRVAIERLDERETVRVKQVDLPLGQKSTLQSGDVIRVFNATVVALPVQRQNKRVRIEGEVTRPGDYVLKPESTLTDAVREAGGTTGAAFLYGSVFTRSSVRESQQLNYDRILRDLEIDLVRSSALQRVSNADDAAVQAASAQNSTRLLERLRSVRPTGRVVLQLPVQGGVLPELALENGDHLYIPPRPSAVGVVGNVFNAGSYLYSDKRTVSDYLRLAGGTTRNADQRNVYVLRANGSVVGGAHKSTWFTSQSAVESLTAEPGDTIVVPEEMNKTTFIQSAKDWTQILFQLGVGFSSIKSALNF